MNLFRIPTTIRKVSKRRKARSGKPGKLGIVRLYGAAKTALRRHCYERDHERCVVCKKWLPFEGPLMERMHMAHVEGTGRATRCLATPWPCRSSGGSLGGF
jgi:hypothetical protein